jgi:tetratricopeptide (TPR) repeat protein
MLGDQGRDGGHDAGGSRRDDGDVDRCGVSLSALVGRASAVAALDRAVAAAAAGRGGLVFITGEAGIGKTALTQEAARRAANWGTLVLWGSCREGPGVPGFWPWVEVLRAYAERVGSGRLTQQVGGAAIGLAGLLPTLGSGLAATMTPSTEAGSEPEREGANVRPSPAPDPVGLNAGDRFRMFDAVATLLRREAVAQPLLVVLDDLQWADAGTVRLLRFLAPDLARTRLLVVGAYRDEEVDAPEHPLRGLLAELAARAELLPLTGLSTAEVAALMSQVAGAPPDTKLAATVHRRTGGNPFFVQQVTQLAVLAPGVPASVPAGVRDAIERRLARLPQACAELLAVAAVAGPELQPEVLAHVTSRLPDELAELLESAVKARILTAAEPAGVSPGIRAFRFVHDLFRECLYEGLEAPARTRLHARLAAALEALGPPGRLGLTGELAHHCGLAVPVVEPAAALTVTRRAAEEATARLAHEEAAGHYAQAVRLAGLANDTAARRSLLLELAEAHRRAGDLTQARGRYLDVAAEARAAGDAPMLARAALGVHQVGGRSLSTHADSIQLLEEARTALDAVDEDGASAGTRARVLACLARDLVHGFGHDQTRAAQLSEQAVTLARCLGDPATLALCLFARHDALWVRGSAGGRLPVVVEMAAAAAAASDLVLGLEARLARFVALLELGDPAAFAAFDEAARAAAELRQPHYRWLVRTRQATLALLAGRLAEADQLIEEAAALAERIGEPDGWNVATAQRLELERLRGGSGAVLTMWRLLIQSGGSGEAVPQFYVDWFQALFQADTLLDRGHAEDAAVVVRSQLEPAVAGGLGWQQTDALVALAEAVALIAAVNADAVADIATRLYQALLPSAAGMAVLGGAVVCRDPVAHHLGVLAAVLARWDEAIGHLQDAIAVGQRLGARPSVARGRCELGRVLLARGGPDDRPRAEQFLCQAADAAGELGMRALAERATAALASLVPPPNPPRPPQRNEFRCDGEVWTLAYAGTVVRLPDAKGLHDIARLLANPGVEIPAADLVDPAARLEASLGADPALDARAQAAYRQRLAELAAEIDTADAGHDLERAARARAERDTLVQALSAAYGLGRRARRLGDAGERARKAVTARIRDSLARLDQRHPALAQHLRQSIHTGAVCAYQPPEPTSWELEGPASPPAGMAATPPPDRG